MTADAVDHDLAYSTYFCDPYGYRQEITRTSTLSAKAFVEPQDTSMNFFPKLLDHVAWADAQVSAAIAALDTDRAERSQATRIYAHVAAAEHIWHSRLEGRSPAQVVWPDLSLEAAAALARESLAGLRAIAAADAETLAREVEYRTSAGQAFRNSVADILSHVALHGSYHRGQIALLTRQGGGAPVATDYVVYARG